MIVNCTLTPNTPLSEEERKMIEEAAKRPIVFDEDSPALTPETRAAFKRAAEVRNARLRQQASGS